MTASITSALAPRKKKGLRPPGKKNEVIVEPRKTTDSKMVTRVTKLLFVRVGQNVF